MTSALNYRWRRGRAGSPTLLLIHPLGGDLGFWDECIDCWGSEVSTLACDLRSAGQSPASHEPVSIDGHVRDLQALLLELGIGSVVPVGCAIGAMTAARFSALHPAATVALVMASPTAKTSEAAARMLAERAELVSRDGMAAVLPGAVDRAFELQARGPRYQAYFKRFAEQDPQAYAQSIRAILDADVTQDLRALTCPALVVAAGHDLLLPPAHAHAVHELVPHAQFTLMPEAAHFAPLQQPVQFAGIVHTFLVSAGLLPGLHSPN